MKSKNNVAVAKDGSNPLIFIHYGPASYLRKALACARKANPEVRIVLLGDDSNRELARGLVEHVSFSGLEDGDNISQFERVFHPIQGDRHEFNKLRGTDFWLTFVFKRWFLISEFIGRCAINSFWTFDSDTLVFAPLSPREKRFAAQQTTTQCRDCCLNGFVGSRELVERYTQCIISLFRDQDYLESQRKRMKQQDGLAFNEMDAFCEFRRRANVRTFHAAQPLEGEFFDDALAYDANFEASPQKVAGRIQVKRLWSSPDSALYAKHLESGHFVRMVTCNLSWLPDYVWNKLIPFCLTPEQDARVKSPIESELREVDLSQPLTDKIATVLKRKVFEVKRALGR